MNPQQLAAKYGPPTAGLATAPAAKSNGALASFFGSTSSQPATQTPKPETGGFAEVGNDIKNDFARRNATVEQSKADVDSGKQSLASGLYQAGGQAAGMVGDAAVDLIKPAIKPEIKQGIKNAIGTVAQTPAGKALADAWGNFEKAHPEMAANIKATGNFASILPIGEGVGSGAKVVDAGVNATTKTAAEAVPKALGAVKQGVKDTAQTIKTAIKDTPEVAATKRIASGEDIMTTKERAQAVDEGRATTGKTGSVTYAPTKTESQAGKILTGKLSGDPIKNVGVIKDEISARGKEAEAYLTDNAKPITNEEHAKIFAEKRTESEKSMTEPELKAYDDQVKTFSKQLPGRGAYNTATYYKALKDFENNVADKLPRGKEALLDPTGVANAKLRAASDVRTAVRDMISSKNTAFKPKMFDLASLYDAKDTTLRRAANIKGNYVSRVVKAIKDHPGYSIPAAVVGGYEAAKVI